MNIKKKKSGKRARMLFSTCLQYVQRAHMFASSYLTYHFSKCAKVAIAHTTHDSHN